MERYGKRVLIGEMFDVIYSTDEVAYGNHHKRIARKLKT